LKERGRQRVAELCVWLVGACTRDGGAACVCARASRLLVRTMVEMVGGGGDDDLQKLYGSCGVAAALAVRKRPPRYSIAHDGLRPR